VARWSTAASVSLISLISLIRKGSSGMAGVALGAPGTCQQTASAVRTTTTMIAARTKAA